MKELKKWMPMFVGEYLADTGHLSTAEHGAYLLLIFHYWVKGGVPWENDEMVRRITKLTPRQWALSRNVLRSFFGDDGHHKRCDIELAYALEKSRVNSTNVSKRYIGRRLPVDTPTPTPTPTKKRKIKTPVAEPPEFLDFWASYPRKTGRHPALVAYCKAGETGDYAQINAAAKRFNIEMAKTDEKYIPHPATWLNQRRYEDYHVQIERDTNLKWDETAKTWRWKDGCDPERTN